MARKSYKTVVRKLNIYKNLPKKVIRGCVQELGIELIDKSPVGNPALWKRPAPKNYKAGHFVKNWQTTVGSSPSSEIEGQDKTKRFTKAAVKKVVKKWDCKQTLYFTNNAPYATALEYGWSTQAPQGMVRTTTKRFNTIFKKSLEQQRKMNNNP